MKIRINFDMVNAILNVNQKFGPFKVIRNNQKRWITVYLPFYLIFDIALLRKVASIPICLILQYGHLLTAEIYYEEVYKRDIYKEKSIEDLKRLAILFNDLNLKTSYDLLLSSELYDKKYKIQVSDNFLNLKEEKYILVPTINYNGEIRDTSILQEHFIGTDDYVLSIGSPEKKLKLAYSNI